jgi:enoyl-[acyl-carrier protein] reductase II
MKRSALCKLLNIEFPIVQAGMVWISGAKLAAAAANSGCLGVIGAGSMTPDLLQQHIIKAKKLTSKPLAVNLPLLYKDIDKQIEIALEHDIKIFITSAGSPKKFTKYLKDKGCIVIHVTSSLSLAKKCELAGVDAVIVEGFEAGGHNGRDELTTLVLIPEVVKHLNIPVIAAGGFSSGESILAGLTLGASAIQIGTRFMMSTESSAHANYKNKLIESSDDATKLRLKKQIPVRLVKNKFEQEIFELENKGATAEELSQHLGRGRAKKGMLEGDIDEGELEAGQICGFIDNIKPVSEIVSEMRQEYKLAFDRIYKE